MFKINKYITRTGISSQLLKRKFSCSEKCPPIYECKQPKHQCDDDNQDNENMPRVFSKKCPKNPRIYRNILLFLFLPAIGVVYYNIEEDNRRPKFVEFTYLRIRHKPYVWDPVRTLFHNPRRNALPTGYEVEVPEEEEYDPFEPDKK